MRNTIKRKYSNWRNEPFITYGLLAVSVLMYLLMSFNGGSQNPLTLMYYGAKINELIVYGEWWRLITPMFLHIGISHLLFNGLILYFLGAQLERILGHFRFLLLYLFSGILGNVASFAINSAMSAGASTAIFGMFASTIVLAKMYPYHAGIQQLSRNYLFLIIINVIMGFTSSSVDNAGHLGGLLGGYLLMYVLSTPHTSVPSRKERIKYGLIYIASFCLLFIIGFLKV